MRSGGRGSLRTLAAMHPRERNALRLVASSHQAREQSPGRELIATTAARRELVRRTGGGSEASLAGTSPDSGTSSFVLPMYPAYSSPNVSSIILSSAPIRSAKRIPNATNSTALQPSSEPRGLDRWSKEERCVLDDGHAVNPVRDESMVLAQFKGDRPVSAQVRM